MTERDDTNGGVGSDDGVERTVRWREGGETHAAPSRTVVEAVATALGTDPKRLRPLYEVVDPEGLDALFEPNDRRSRRSVNGHVAFRYEGCDVSVHADGRTVVSRSGDDSD